MRLFRVTVTARGDGLLDILFPIKRTMVIPAESAEAVHEEFKTKLVPQLALEGYDAELNDIKEIGNQL